MPRLRTFLGIDLGGSIRDRLSALQEVVVPDLPEVKWVEPENLHVTLLFLGEVDDRIIPNLCRTAQEAVAKTPSFMMQVEGIGCFPHKRRPRVLWVGVGEGREAVCAVHDAIEKPLLDQGSYRREGRGYTPHVTLGRIRSERPNDMFAAVLSKYGDWSAGEVLVSEVHVMSSELTRTGPRYTVLSRAKLASG